MNIIKKSIKNKNSHITIYGIQTGKLAIKRRALVSKNPGIWSTILSFRDKEFGDWLPIWTWLIEHPEGTFLIDTGLSSEVTRNNYFKNLDIISKYYFEQQMKFEINKADEINNQLKQIGYNTDSITKVVLTHLHLDHTGGLKHFPNTPILVNEKEWRTKDGSFPKLFPDNLQIEKIKLNNKFENFDNSYFLTKSKDLVLVETQGHTRGHTSVILKSGEHQLIFFAGDLVYNEKRLINKTFSATIKSYKKSVATCDRIIELATRKKIIFLPSHDSENGKRLINEIEI